MTPVVTDIGYKLLLKRIEDKRIEVNFMKEQVSEMNSNVLSSDDSSEINEHRMNLEYLQTKLNELEYTKSSVKIIDVATIPSDKVYFGSVVTIQDIDSEEEFVYRIVCEIESNPAKGLLSYTSPLGKSLFRQHEGDIVELELGKIYKEFEILSICTEPLKDSEY